MFLDCGRGVGLRFGGSLRTNNSAILQNSYFNPVSRLNCDACYKNNRLNCSNSIGMRLLVSTDNTQSLPTVYGDSIQEVTGP